MRLDEQEKEEVWVQTSLRHLKIVHELIGEAVTVVCEGPCLNVEQHQPWRSFADNPRDCLLCGEFVAYGGVVLPGQQTSAAGQKALIR